MTRRWRVTGLAYLLLALISLAGALVTSHAANLSVAATAVTILPTAAPLFLAWRVFREDRSDLQQAVTIEDLCDQVAFAVRGQWETEIRLRSVDDPYPLPVSWGPGPPDLFDAPLPAGEPESHDDPLDSLVAAASHGRLIVLGNPGSGKTILLIRLVLRMTTSRGPSDPAPLLLPLASWNPMEQDFPNWVKQRLEIEHPSLRLEVPPSLGSGITRSQALLERGLICPVLDGLDELPREVRSLALRKIDESLSGTGRLVLSSRVNEFREATRPPGARPLTIRQASGIEVLALTPELVADYWKRDAGDSFAARRWDDVVARLHRQGPIPSAFRTPLMVSLAKVIYNPRPGEPIDLLPDPRELCDERRFSSSRLIQRHLFDGFVRAAYRDVPALRRPAPGRWDVVKSTRWMHYLALHLESNQRGTPDLRWWEIPSAVRRTMTVATAFVVFLLLLTVAYAPAFIGGVGSPGRSRTPFIVLAVLLATAAGLAVLFKSSTSPAQGLRWSQAKGGAAIVFGVVFGFQGMVLAGATMYFLSDSLAGGLAFGFLGLLGGVFIALIFGLETTPADLGKISSPAGSLIRDRNAFRILALIFGITFGLASSVSFGLAMGSVETPARLVQAGRPDLVRLQPSTAVLDAEAGIYWAYVGAVTGLALGVVFGLARSAWASYALASAYLALRRQLPWRLMSFLNDAHLARGILRQAGPVYQFRHIELQRRLAETAPADAARR